MHACMYVYMCLFIYLVVMGILTENHRSGTLWNEGLVYKVVVVLILILMVILFKETYTQRSGLQKLSAYLWAMQAFKTPPHIQSSLF